MAKILVHIEVDMLDQWTESDSEMKLVEGHVSGMEVSDLEGRGLG